MAEATREFAIAKTMEILRAYVRKIETARGILTVFRPKVAESWRTMTTMSMDRRHCF